MKKLVFGLIATVMFSTLGYSNNEKKTNPDLKATTSVEVEKSNSSYPCRWRLCYYRNGILLYCDAWTYGECLEEVIIK